MKTRSFEREIFIKSDAATVIGVIADYSQYPEIHPLIIKAERARDEPTGVKRYFITGSLKWGPFKFKTRYRADIISVADDTVYTNVYRPPGTFITNLTRIAPQGSGILLYETITMRAPDMLFEYAFQKTKLHRQRCLNVLRDLLKHRRKGYIWILRCTFKWNAVAL